MIFLVCESSTLLGSVAIFRDEHLLAYRESVRQGSHTNVINHYVDEVLKEAKLELADVQLFVSGTGPGSFTGIRISLNLIKTFAYCHNKSVLGINSLENLASQVEFSKLPIISMINAYKNMVYIATYSNSSGNLTVVKEPSVVRVQNLKDYIQTECLTVGDGFSTYANYLSANLPLAVQGLVHKPNPAHDDPKANAVASLVLDKYLSQSMHWSKFLPLYLRASEAEEVKQGIKFQPLI